MFAAVVVNIGSQNVTASTAELYADFTLSEGSFVSNIGFEYRKVGTSTYTASSGFPGSLSDPGGRSGITAGGLDASTTYEFRVKYRANGSLTYTYSSLSEFTTPAFDAAVVTTYDASNIAGTTADLNADIQVGSQTPLLNVHFEWGDESATVGNYDNSTTSQNISADDVFTEGISSLVLGTTYYFRIVATDESSGTALLVYGDEKSFVATAVPTITGFSNHLTDEFDIAWSFSGTASTYYLDIATDAGFTSMLAGYDNLNTGNVTSYNVSGCAAGTVYYARLRAELSSGGTTGNSATDNTITICDAPTALAASAIGATQFTANWDAETGASSYLLDVSLTNTFLAFVGVYNDYEVAGGASISQIVSSLSPVTDYYYRLRAKNSSGNSDYSNIIGPVTTLALTEIEWTGLIDNDWDDAGNWDPNGLPDDETIVIIPEPSNYTNYPIVNLSTTVKEIRVSRGADIEIGARNTLTILEDFLLEASSLDHATIKLNARSGLLVGGTSTVETYLAKDEWHFISMPITSATMAQVFYQDEDPKIYAIWHDETVNWTGSGLCDECWTYVNDGTMPLNIMEGYSVWAADKSTTVYFQGTLNTGTTYSYNLVYESPGSQGWNIVGNPYPCNLDWDLIHASNTSLIDEFYIWIGGSGNYGSYAGDAASGLDGSIIPSTQSFFHRVTGNTSISILRGHQVLDDQSYYKETKASIENQVNLKISGAQFWDEMAVVIDDNAQNSFEDGKDAFKLWGYDNAPQLYATTSDQQDVSIDRLPRPNGSWNFTLPITVYLWHENEYSFSARYAESFPDDVKVQLHDKVAEKFFDLNTEDKYTIEADSGFYTDRFELVFNDGTSINEQSVNASSLEIKLINNSVLSFESNSKSGNLTGLYSVYNLQGQKIQSGELIFDMENKSKITLKLNNSEAYYVVVANINGEIFSKKIFIN